MTELPRQARVVVIGGGAIGASCLYHLALAGWGDVVLLERAELTAGSTWHAAGNVPTFSASPSIMALQRESAGLYRGLAEAVDYPINYHVTGSIRLGHTADRVAEFRHVAAAGRRQGLDLEVVGPNDLCALHPFLETHGIAGALLDPVDGDIDPAQLTQALAKGARDRGARIVRFCPATGLLRRGREWVVETPQGEIACEVVVNAAGYGAGRVAALFAAAGHPRRAPLPMAVMSHQYLLFEEIPAIVAWSREHGRKLPLLRDVDDSYYLRQEKGGLNLGPYERDCRAHWTGPEGDGEEVPEDFAFQLWPDDLERIEPQLESACARMPVLATAGLSRVVNGPIPYTPDGHPLIGPMPGVPGVFEACAFTFGICQAGGAGRALAQWVVEGAPERDLWNCDPRRFTAHASEPRYALAKAREVYADEYAVHFPRHHWPAGRPQKRSPVHGRLEARGAVWGAANGWERALWFAAPGDDASPDAARTWRREGPWHARVRRECLAVRDGVGVIDLPGLSRFELEGPGVAAWLGAQIIGTVPRVGRVGLGHFADDRGRVVCEMCVVRHGENELTLIAPAAAQWHDREWLEGTLPDAVRLADETEGWTAQLVTGPGSRALLAAASDFDPRLPWLSRQRARIAGRDATLLRMSVAGELGWEVHARTDDAPAVWDALWEAGAPLGLRPVGMHALDSLRLEKGHGAWKAELTRDHTALEAGLGRLVRWSKGAFRGRPALEAERQRGSARRAVTLVVEADGCDAPPASTIWRGAEVVGETTSGGWGHRTGRSLALGTVRADAAGPGAALAVEILGTRAPATVAPHAALHDPAGERLRA